MDFKSFWVECYKIRNVMVYELESPRTSPLRHRIGVRIKQSREQLGLTQEDFAEAMRRSSRKWVWDVETGRTAVSVDELVQLSRVLHKPVLWLLGEGGEDAPEEDELIAGFRALPEDGRRWLLGSLRGMLGQTGQST